MAFAMVFPGQGSQAVGMMAELYDEHEIIPALFNTASDRLGFDLWSLIRNGPKEELDKTENTQPALLACGIAMWRVWRQAGGGIPKVVAGHSLGEYCALIAAGVLEFGDAITLVRDRGRYMQLAVPPGCGGMAAILGLEDEQVTEICRRFSDKYTVSVANVNSPGQVVIAGQTEAVGRVMEAAKAAGAKRTIKLDVSVPSHCALMTAAADQFLLRLNQVEFNNASIPVIQNADTGQRTEADALKAAMPKQLYQPVRWTDTILKIKRQGILHIVECGPGRVLSGLIKRIDSELTAYPVFDSATLATTLMAVTV